MSLPGPSHRARAETETRLSSLERAEKMGQNLNRIPYKDTFWKGTTRTRPSESAARGGRHRGWAWAPGPGPGGSWGPDRPAPSGNGTLNKHSGIDFKQLNFLTKLNENHSGEVTPAPPAPLPPPTALALHPCQCLLRSVASDPAS